MAKASTEPLHVDDFIWGRPCRDQYARFVLMIFRLPAAEALDWMPWLGKYKLFCTYEGKRYRCVGASRMGDVWLHEDLANEHTSDGGKRSEFYQLRVNVEACSEWSAEPAAPQGGGQDGPA